MIFFHLVLPVPLRPYKKAIVTLSNYTVSSFEKPNEPLLSKRCQLINQTFLKTTQKILS